MCVAFEMFVVNLQCNNAQVLQTTVVQIDSRSVQSTPEH